MKVPLRFKPFDILVNKLTNKKVRSKYMDSKILDIDVEDDYIEATVKGTRTYYIEIDYDESEVYYTYCTCPYQFENIDPCKHIVHVLVEADRILREKIDEYDEEFDHYDEIIIGNNEEANVEEEAIVWDPNILTKSHITFTLRHPNVLGLPESLINQLSVERTGVKRNWKLRPTIIQAAIDKDCINGSISISGFSYGVNKVSVEQSEGLIKLQCDCHNPIDKLCTHLSTFLLEAQTNNFIQLAFDTKARHKYLTQSARDYAIDANNIDLDEFFRITLSYGDIYINLKVSLLDLKGYHHRDTLKRDLLTTFELPKDSSNDKEFVIVKKQAYEDQLNVCLASAPLAKNGNFKTPVTEINPSIRIRKAAKREEILFFSSMMAINSHQRSFDNYRDIIKNPFGFDFYYYDEGYSKSSIKPKNLVSIKPSIVKPIIEIQVRESGNLFVLTCQLTLDNQRFKIEQVEVFKYLLLAKNKLFILNNEAESKVLLFFKNKKESVYVQMDEFTSFKADFLDHLENNVSISYSFIKHAPAAVVKSQKLDTISKPILYLTDMDNYVAITPTIAYGDVEVPILSRRTAMAYTPDGKAYAIKRDEAAEHKFIRTLQGQHSSFEDTPQTEFFYLHKNEFLDDGWFINAFEVWRNEGFQIHGFNKLKNNRYNQNPINVQTSVRSGIDWFDIHADISFGDQKVSLRQLQKSVANKSRFIELSDGTQGILPQEWLEKFSNYFRSGEIRENSIRSSKTNFQIIDELFEQEVLSKEVQEEIMLYKEKLANFQSISSVKIPKKLKTTLRDYQKEGLNWLNFLDEFGFGGCLADDMGLGKTVQIIAYFLAQHEKGNKGTNLVVLPTSLLFNWQKELDKFAPNLRYHVLYGVNRNTEKLNLSKYHILLTTYGTLLSDIQWLKEQNFNIIVLDESQAIKNPNSKRYKAVRLLQGRQRLVLTGTPVENNTFDLYAQLSFAVPGLLGGAKRFASDYSTPIDKFQDSKRAQELQRKIHPFVLRRTKKQVALELPEKTEMTVYCEMGTEQKRVYDSYKLEFQKYLSGLDESELHSSSLHVLQGLTKLRQICNSPSLLSDEEYYGDDSAKLTELMEQINTLKDEHKIIVFSQFVGMLDLIKGRLDKEGINYAYLTGQTKDRQEQVDRFQEDKAVRVFLISLKAGGTGLNLTQAEYVFLVDPWWNPAVENQAIDRAYRIGQENRVIAVRLVTPDSIEEKIIELQQRKRQLADELIHADGSMLKQLTKDDLMAML